MADFKISFAGDSNLYSLYQHVITDYSIDPQEIDQSWEVIDFEKPREINNKVVGKAGDKVLDAEEFLDFLSKNYKRFPREVRSIIGNDIPWSLDDFDSSTSFDKEIRARVRKAGLFLDDLLAKQGIDSGSLDYRQRKAYGMVLFALCPSFDQLTKNKQLTSFVDKTLTKYQLREFRLFLKKNPGLGVFLFDEICTKDLEMSALEAIKQRKGDCTERANILYGIFEEVGLDPVLLDVDLIKSTTFNKKILSIYNVSGDSSKLTSHAAVGLKLGGKLVYFDLTDYFVNDVIPQAYFQLPFKDMLRDAVINYNTPAYFDAKQSEDEGKLNEVRKPLERLKAFGVDSLIYASESKLTSILMGLGECIGALDSVGISKRVNPNNFFIMADEATTVDHCKGDNTKAWAIIESIYDRYPFVAALRDQYIGFLLDAHQHDKAVEKLEEGIGKYPNDPFLLYDLAQAYFYSRSFEKAIKAIEGAHKLEPENNSILYMQSVIYWEAGAKKLAIMTRTERYRILVSRVKRNKDIGHADKIMEDEATLAKTVPYDFFIEGHYKANKLLFYNLGDLYVAHEEWSKALDAYYRVLKLDGMDEKAHLKIYQVHVRRGRLDIAKRILEQYKSLTGKDLKTNK